MGRALSKAGRRASIAQWQMQADDKHEGRIYSLIRNCQFPIKILLSGTKMGQKQVKMPVHPTQEVYVRMCNLPIISISPVNVTFLIPCPNFRRKRNTADSGYGSEQPLDRRWSQEFSQEVGSVCRILSSLTVAYVFIVFTLSSLCCMHPFKSQIDALIAQESVLSAYNGRAMETLRALLHIRDITATPHPRMTPIKP